MPAYKPIFGLHPCHGRMAEIRDDPSMGTKNAHTVPIDCSQRNRHRLPLSVCALHFGVCILLTLRPNLLLVVLPSSRDGNGSLGQMGHHFWMGHMGHRSLPVTH